MVFDKNFSCVYIVDYQLHDGRKQGKKKCVASLSQFSRFDGFALGFLTAQRFFSVSPKVQMLKLVGMVFFCRRCCRVRNFGVFDSFFLCGGAPWSCWVGRVCLQESADVFWTMSYSGKSSSGFTFNL